MTLYQHYKKKNYKLLGIAKHSETLEDLAVYEALYPNEASKLWVRPKAMFFDQIELGGVKSARFKELKPQIKVLENPPPEDLLSISNFVQTIFTDLDLEKIQERLQGKKNILVLTAELDGVLCAFKFGYQESEETFYSWLGAVHPDYRGLRIASVLMQAQHNWCKSAGFKKVRTKSQNQYKAMIKLNLNFGFDVTGTEESDRGLKIILEKIL